LLRHYWSRPGLEIFGKHGERQYGIGILDVGGQMPIYAAQCKLRQEHKSLTPGEIQAEVDEAQKACDVQQAEAQAQVGVRQAKAESDAMQYTLPHRVF
jgi:hypothetical protein